MPFSIRAISTYCFIATGDGPAQVVWAEVGRDDDGGGHTPVTVSMAGPDIVCADLWQGEVGPGQKARAELAFTPRPGRGGFAEGEPLEVDVVVSFPDGKSERSLHHIVAHEPGWAMYMVSHFHYDPVWWNTQAGYTSAWDDLAWAQDSRDTFQHNGLVLVEAHLERARMDPDYKFVLAEVDYLQPFWHLYPDRRDEIRALVGQGRMDLVGGTYNEPNTNLVGYETAARCAVYGMGFQRDVMGASPATAWQLDVFAHDPSFPSLMAQAGVLSSSWARGPFHQWGPKHHAGSTTWMQFPSEFEWLGPDGASLVTSYMADHYSAGWQLDGAATVEEAMAKAYELFCDLAAVSAGKCVMLPVGTDYTPPNRWVTELARAWNAKYISPALMPALPKDFFAALDADLAVRSDEAQAPARLLPQTREMGPVYTGKDVSFIDTKQANRLAEHELAEAETWATFALGLGYAYPERALDKAWRQLVFNSHHDGITGSESDQVYLDLLGGWREAFELARGVKERALAELSSHTPGPAVGADGATVVVFNRMGHPRSGLVRAEVPVAVAPGVVQRQGGLGAVTVISPSGEDVPCLVTAATGVTGATGTGRPVPGPDRQAVIVEFVAHQVPAFGWRCYRVVLGPGPSNSDGWSALQGAVISNEHWRVVADPRRGGCLSSVVEIATGVDLVADGEVANELVVYEEYPTHPQMSEGPWHLMPRRELARSSRAVSAVSAERSCLGERLVISGEIAGARYTQVVSLITGQRRIELSIFIHDYDGVDRLVRLRFGFSGQGASPLAETGQSVIGRSRGLVGRDSAEFPWTLDSPAQNWAGIGPSLLVRLATRESGREGALSLGVGDVVVPDQMGAALAASTRALVLSFLQKGVTASCSPAGSNRYGGLSGDSNLPDFRLVVGGPRDNAFTAAVLEDAGDDVARFVRGRLAAAGRVRALVWAHPRPHDPASPVVDVRSVLDLPVLIIAGDGEEATSDELAALAAEVAREGTFSVDEAPFPGNGPAPVPAPPSHTAAVLNRGTPGYVVGEDGALYVSLLRSCTGWPSGVWIDPPRRTAPDGSNFELEHWDHEFTHAIVGGWGDWRSLGTVREGREFNAPLSVSVVASPLAGGGFGNLGYEGSFIELRAGTGDVQLMNVKPYGHNLARGVLASSPHTSPLSAGESEVPEAFEVPEDFQVPQAFEVSVRAYETSGAPASMSLGAGVFVPEAVSRCDLMETAGGHEEQSASGPIALGPCEVVTVRARLRQARAKQVALGAKHVGLGDGDGARLSEPAGPAALAVLECETAQPVYGRYWLHNKGPAPLGNSLLAVHVRPMSLCAVPGGDPVEVEVSVSSGATAGTQEGDVEVLVPKGWVWRVGGVTSEQRGPGSAGIFSLAPGAFRRFKLQVDVAPRARPGRYFVLARVTDGHGQAIEDVVTVDVVGRLGPPRAQGRLTFSPEVAGELELELGATALRVAAGGTAHAQLRMKNRTKSEIHGEVQLISPLETWPYTGPWVQPFAVAPGGTRACALAVRAPLGSSSLHSWCLLKVMYFGRVWYSPAIALRLGDRSRSTVAGS
ncbi:MAG TPA: glycoside hydrolase family 38 C-terminal domain-containing protein [Acidimicrobiales bacterium]|nr:glycoside hydrolase family 38 C-terminal domain-containing protein [Acidimicrobiales bacterium]